MPPTSSFPYTDDDVLRAAIRAHRTLINRMDPETAAHCLSLQPDWPWVEAGSDEHDMLCKKVVDLVLDAPSMAQLAIELGAAGLDQTQAHAWNSTDGLDIAVHLAAHSRLRPAIRNEMMRAVRTSVETVYAKFLGKEPHRHVPESGR